MKKKLLLLVILSFLVGGVVSAATMWGTFQGNSIIRITVDGVPIKVSDVPAVNLNGRTMVPLYLLQQAGIQYEWDGKNQTVDIKKNAPPPAPQKLTVKDIYKLTSDAVGYVEALDANGNMACSGSGVMVSPGYFVTNFHVASCGNSGRLRVKINGDTYSNGDSGWYRFGNKDTDLFGAVVTKTLDANGKPTGNVPDMKFDISNAKMPQIGDKVYAIGSPLGLENTVTEGIVSGIRTINGMTMIQHTCNTTHGSSGGALMDEKGFLIGITSAGYDGTNENFAIPISYVKDEIDKLNK